MRLNPLSLSIKLQILLLCFHTLEMICNFTCVLWFVTCSTTSAVMQVYLKSVLESFLHPQPSIRMASLHVVNSILRQGLVHPVQVGSHTCFDLRFGMR